MKKNEKRTYLSPETEVVRFTADIITTSDYISPSDEDNTNYNDPESNALLPNS